MIIRQTLNFTAHLVAGAAMGALAVTTLMALKRRQRENWNTPVGPDDTIDEAIEPR